ncbi:copper resistance CopC family protein [Bacillus weihaiensis]|uniref:copper resistance CopC family protein n=1 Tax=Bacillus weihaiensis TaxID=1547283 RepID=UPI002354039B|nr:copper resistance CopC family protein [Bacillus weihaiensis]
MKKLFVMLCLLCLAPFVAHAHTTISSSTPGTDEVVTTPLAEYVVEFAAEIEKQSTMSIESNSGEIKFEDIVVEDKKILGQLNTPLENGEYTLVWKIAAKDGHIITGDIPFTVSLPKEVEEEEPDTASEENAELDTEQDEVQTDEPETLNKEEAQTEQPDLNNESNETEIENETTQENGNTSILIIIFLILLLGAGMLFLFRKKR